MGTFATIDELDIKIIKYLEKDARSSLKKLAENLKKKTSTIYHRLQRLQNNNIIQGYSVLFNQEIYDIQLFGLIRMFLKPHNIKGLDNMFIESFAKFLQEEYENITFLSTIKKMNQIIALIPFKDEDTFIQFQKKIMENPYVENIEYEFLDEVIKGHALFNFNKNFIKNNVLKLKSEEESDEKKKNKEKEILESAETVEFKDYNA